jgi:hypothetical protein
MATATDTTAPSSIRPGMGSLSILAAMVANIKVQDSIMNLMDLYTKQGRSIYSGAMIDARIKLNSYNESYHKMHEILISRGFDVDEIQHHLSIG